MTVIKNKFLQQLHKRLNKRKINGKRLDKETKSRIVKRVLADMEDAHVFSEEEISEDSFYQIEQTTDIIFSNASKQEKINALRAGLSNPFYQEEEAILEDVEERITAKQAELSRHPEFHQRRQNRKKTEPRKIYNKATRFGRSPLHEAISFKDVEAIKNFAKQGLYLNYVDNNGHTPLQMARYCGYKEAINILERIQI